MGISRVDSIKLKMMGLIEVRLLRVSTYMYNTIFSFRSNQTLDAPHLPRSRDGSHCIADPRYQPKNHRHHHRCVVFCYLLCISRFAHRGIQYLNSVGGRLSVCRFWFWPLILGFNLPWLVGGVQESSQTTSRLRYLNDMVRFGLGLASGGGM